MTDQIHSLDSLGTVKLSWLMLYNLPTSLSFSGILGITVYVWPDEWEFVVELFILLGFEYDYYDKMLVSAFIFALIHFCPVSKTKVPASFSLKGPAVLTLIFFPFCAVTILILFVYIIYYKKKQ